MIDSKRVRPQGESRVGGSNRIRRPPVRSLAGIRVAGASLDPGVPRTLFGLPGPSVVLGHGPYNRFAVSADGQRFLLSQPGTGGPTTVGGLADTIATVVDRGGIGSTGTTNAVKVVLNWTQMLKKK